jgi:membrane-bound lytic murein transglycosylase
MITLIFASLITAHGDSVRDCLDNLRKQHHGNKPAMHFGFHPAAKPPPSTCLQGDLDGVKTALKDQIANCKGPTTATKTSIQIACRLIQRDEWCLDTNTQLLHVAENSADLPAFLKNIKTQFDWYQGDGFPTDQKDKNGNVVWKKGATQFTAYDSPEYTAFAAAAGDATYPIYEKPGNLVQIPETDPANCGLDDITSEPIKWCLATKDASGHVTYSRAPTREDIDNGKLPGLKAIAYMTGQGLMDLQIEGSGFVDVTDAKGKKTKIPIGFEAENGQPLSLLGNILNCLPNPPKNPSQYMASLSPAELKKLLEYDRSYIFFTQMLPEGSEHIPVTPLHSIASDHSNVPVGMFSVLNTVAPAGTTPSSCKSATFVAIAQDSGGAIIGPHFDIYMGDGAAAQKAANSVDSPGTYFIALSKGAGTPVSGCK